MHDDDDRDDEHPLDKTSVVASDTFKRRIDEAEQTPPALVMLMGPARYVGRQWLLNVNEMVIGRANESAIYVDDRTIDSHIKRLRKKFRSYDNSFDQIRTRYGSGYSWRD